MAETVREASPDDAAALGKVEVETWRTAYRGIHPDAVLDSLSYEDAAARWTAILETQAGRGQFTYVLEESAGRVVGYASGMPRLSSHAEPELDAFAGELGRLYVLPAQQGNGLGRRLVRAVVSRLEQAGMRSMLVTVLSANAPARGFYEALGGRYFITKPITVRGLASDHAVYGWPDTQVLLGPARTT